MVDAVLEGLLKQWSHEGNICQVKVVVLSSSITSALTIRFRVRYSMFQIFKVTWQVIKNTNQKMLIFLWSPKSDILQLELVRNKQGIEDSEPKLFPHVLRDENSILRHFIYTSRHLLIQYLIQNCSRLNKYLDQSIVRQHMGFTIVLHDATLFGHCAILDVVLHGVHYIVNLLFVRSSLHILCIITQIKIFIHLLDLRERILMQKFNHSFAKMNCCGIHQL